jgi:hypothetical protein
MARGSVVKVTVAVSPRATLSGVMLASSVSGGSDGPGVPVSADGEDVGIVGEGVSGVEEGFSSPPQAPRVAARTEVARRTIATKDALNAGLMGPPLRYRLCPS